MVDLQAVIDRSERADQIRQDLEGVASESRNRLEDKRRRVQKLRQKLEKQGAIMSEEQRNKRRQELQEAVRAFRQARRSARQDLQRRQSRVLQELYSEIQAIAARLAEERDLERVLRASAVLVPGEAVDLTDAVLERLDSSANGEGAGKGAS
jgi:outer membrane protein